MKKFFFVVLAMVMLGSVQAQTAFKNKVEGLTGTEFYFGPKFGFNVASISDGLNKSKFSFHLGAFAEFKFNDLFGLQNDHRNNDLTNIMTYTTCYADTTSRKTYTSF